MSKIRIQGSSGTGTVTLTSSVSNTDRTITLPDEDITLGGAQSHTSSGTVPSSPSIGDKWHDTTNEKLYMRTNDGTSDLWLQI